MRMNPRKSMAAVAGALTLAGCERPQEADSVPTASPTIETSEPGAENASLPDRNTSLAPPVLTPQAEGSVKGARNILLSFARAIEQGQYGQAWALLSPADQRKWSRTQFAAIFADLGKITVAVPDGKTETRRGSTAYVAPVTVTGNDKDGRPVRIEGTAVLRLANDGDRGTSTPAGWRFEKLTLDWTH